MSYGLYLRPPKMSLDDCCSILQLPQSALNGPNRWQASHILQVASIIFLESPAFVGWSYSNRTEDRVVGDKRTAADALSFLLGFFQRFPQFKDRPFWIAGESYGGVSCPPDFILS